MGLMLGLHECVLSVQRHTLYVVIRRVCGRKGYWWIIALTFEADPITAFHLTLPLPFPTSSLLSYRHNTHWLINLLLTAVALPHEHIHMWTVGLKCQEAEHGFNLTCMPNSGPSLLLAAVNQTTSKFYMCFNIISKRLKKLTMACCYHLLIFHVRLRMASKFQLLVTLHIMKCVKTLVCALGVRESSNAVKCFSCVYFVCASFVACFISLQLFLESIQGNTFI